MANPFSNTLDGYVPGQKKGWQAPAPSPHTRQIQRLQAQNNGQAEQLAELLERLARLENSNS